MNAIRVSRRSRGFTLLELMIVMVILATLAVYKAAQIREELELQMAQQAAENITLVGEATSAYISFNSASLGPDQVITAATLRADNFLPSTFVPTLPWSGGGDYSIRIRRVSATPPAYEALVLTTTPWSINGDVRQDLLGEAVKRIGAAGGMTFNNTDGAFGLGGGWSAPVALYPQAANGSASPTDGGGLLAYYVNQATNPNDILYLRRDGSNTMLGALQMNGNSIAGAVDVTATGAVNAATMTATGAVNAGSVAATGAVSGGSLASAGNISMGAGGTLSSAGRIHIQAGETLYLQPYANGSGSETVIGGLGGSGNLTASNRISAQNDVTIAGLATDRGASNTSTTSLKTLAPKLVEMGTAVVTAHGQTVPAPTCINGGSPAAFILPNAAYGFVDAGRFGSDIRLSGPVGGVFTVIARDAAGSPIPSATIPAGQFNGIVRTFCQY